MWLISQTIAKYATVHVAWLVYVCLLEIALCEQLRWLAWECCLVENQNVVHRIAVNGSVFRAHAVELSLFEGPICAGSKVTWGEKSPRQTVIRFVISWYKQTILSVWNQNSLIKLLTSILYQFIFHMWCTLQWVLPSSEITCNRYFMWDCTVALI